MRVAVILVITLAVAGCSNLPKDGRYQTHGGGWDNFRAETLTPSTGRLS